MIMHNSPIAYPKFSGNETNLCMVQMSVKSVNVRLTFVLSHDVFVFPVLTHCVSVIFVIENEHVNENNGLSCTRNRTIVEL